MKKLMVVIVLFLVGCGGSEKLVEIHHVDQSIIDRVAGYPGEPAYAKWQNDEPYDKCDIYILPRQQYESEEWYHFYLGHELRHCFEGHFHE